MLQWFTLKLKHECVIIVIDHYVNESNNKEHLRTLIVPITMQGSSYALFHLSTMLCRPMITQKEKVCNIHLQKARGSRWQSCDWNPTPTWSSKSLLIHQRSSPAILRVYTQQEMAIPAEEQSRKRDAHTKKSVLSNWKVRNVINSWNDFRYPINNTFILSHKVTYK